MTSIVHFRAAGTAASLAAVLMTSACAPAADEATDARSNERDVFVGHLVAFDGQPVDSMWRVRLFSTDGDEVADRYFMRSDCFDAGYFDQRHGMFLSGHSPIGTDTEKSRAEVLREAAERHRTRCPADDPQHYSKFVELMLGGATLEIDGDRARLVSKAGSTAELSRVVEPFMD